MDPAEAIDALLEELYRQKAAGVKRVSVSDESVALLKELAGGPTASAAPKSVAPRCHGAGSEARCSLSNSGT